MTNMVIIILVMMSRALKISTTNTMLYGAFQEPSSTLIGPSRSTFFKLINAMTNVSNVPTSATYLFIIGRFPINMSKIAVRIGMTKVKTSKLLYIIFWRSFH